MALRRLGTSGISHGFMALLKLAMMNIFTALVELGGIASHHGHGQFCGHQKCHVV